MDRANQSSRVVLASRRGHSGVPQMHALCGTPQKNAVEVHEPTNVVVNRGASDQVPLPARFRGLEQQPRRTVDARRVAGEERSHGQRRLSKPLYVTLDDFP